MISRELLLELKLFDSIENREWNFEINGNTLKVIYNITNCFSGNWFTINIYELAHKCKEWAYNKGYEIVSLAHMIRIYKNGYEVYYTNSTLFDLDMFFKACQWILDNKKEGN